MQTSELGRLQVLAGVIEHQSQYLPPVKLTESEQAEYELFWENFIGGMDFSQLTEEESGIASRVLEYIKKFTLKIWAGVSKAGEIVFKNLNKIVYWTLTNLLMKPFNALLVGLGVGGTLVYQTLVKKLDFEMFGKEFTFGTDLNASVMQTIESNWESLIGFIQSYEPTGVAKLPIEILTETLAAGLKAIGIVIPKAITATQAVAEWLLSLGLGNVAVVISWLYLIGGSMWLFEKAKGILAPSLKTKLISQVEQETKQTDQTPKQLPSSDQIS